MSTSGPLTASSWSAIIWARRLSSTIRGLAALLLLGHARSRARVVDGELVPTHLQDTARWDPRLVEAAERLLVPPADAYRIGRFQLEAAIQSVHCDRRRTCRTEWGAIAQLYSVLVRIRPTRGSRAAHAVAVRHAVGPAEGLALLAHAEDDGASRTFQPALAARAWLLRESGAPRWRCVPRSPPPATSPRPSLSDVCCSAVWPSWHGARSTSPGNDEAAGPRGDPAAPSAVSASAPQR